MATVSLGVLGVMGAMLSITGIFGMAAYSVSKRLRELGIRIALGAQRKEVLQAALGRAFKLLAFGSAAGLLLGILATRVLAFIVYQATPRDPLVLAGVVLAMVLLGLLATWIPAQRALSVDPADPAARGVMPRPSIGMMRRTQRACPQIAILPNSDRDKWWYSGWVRKIDAGALGLMSPSRQA